MNINLNEKPQIVNWLNTQINDKCIIFDYVLDIKDQILSQLSNNDLELKYDENIFLINLIDYLYNNSHTKF
mgnify:CR=1 FL=1